MMIDLPFLVVYVNCKSGNAQALQVATKQMDFGENADLAKPREKGSTEWETDWFHPELM